MSEALIYTLLAVLAVSAISLVGVFFISLGAERARRILFLFVALAVGALLGDAFLHLLPEASEMIGHTSAALWALGGIMLFFVLEKILHWHHGHHVHDEHKEECADYETRVKPFGKLIIASDALHNIIDGVIIAAGFLVSVEVGIATTIAVALHEIPQEVGDFGVLLHSGMSRGKALLANFASALSAFIGAGLVFVIGTNVESAIPALSACAAGAFIYIAIADLVPELHKTKQLKWSLAQLAFVLVGIGLMISLGALEGEHGHELENDTAQPHEQHEEVPHKDEYGHD